MEPFDRRLPADASFERVAAELAALNADEAVSGVLLQLPVPDQLDGPDADGHDRPRRRTSTGSRRSTPGLLVARDCPACARARRSG